MTPTNPDDLDRPIPVTGRDWLTVWALAALGVLVVVLAVMAAY